tara:strand:- start:110 stop:673 length:564 start_codon:yes stop_codon:yes gene_type:complete
MRIISGKFKGKKLAQPLDKNTRPLKDIVKESIFNLIVHSKLIKLNLKESNILDLFSGSGSFGIECLSRNVKHVTFIENYNSVINVLKKNINEFNADNNYDLIEKNIYDEKIYINLNKKYDLIFVDPPYKEKKIEKIFSLIKNYKILKKNGYIILHRNKKSHNYVQNNFEIIDVRSYGISKIIFYKLK